MNVDRLFLATMHDLERRLDQARTEYDVLMIAPLLRKLLLDARPLIHQVNRRRLRLVFRYNGRKSAALAMQPVFWAIQDGLDPDTALALPVTPVDATLDKFLAVRVMVVNGQDFSVRDVIDLTANAEGGVHAGTTRQQRQKVMQEVERTIRFGNLPPAVRTLLAIGRVTRAALEPLRQRVADDIG